MRRAERPRGAAAAGSLGAITTAGPFPEPEPQTSRSILLLTTNFSGGRWRQRCRALWLQRRLRHRLGARGRQQLCVAAPPGSERGALARPRTEALGAGARRGRERGRRGTVPAGPPAARAAPSSAAAAPRLISGPARTRPAAARLAAQPPVAIAMFSPPPHVADSNWLRGRGSPNTLSRPRL